MHARERERERERESEVIEDTFFLLFALSGHLTSFTAQGKDDARNKGREERITRARDLSRYIIHFFPSLVRSWV